MMASSSNRRNSHLLIRKLHAPYKFLHSKAFHTFTLARHLNRSVKDMLHLYSVSFLFTRQASAEHLFRAQRSQRAGESPALASGECSLGSEPSSGAPCPCPLSRGLIDTSPPPPTSSMT